MNKYVYKYRPFSAVPHVLLYWYDRKTVKRTKYVIIDLATGSDQLGVR